MTITITNQTPAVLDPVHTISCSGDYDPVPSIKSTLVTPLMQPLTPGTTPTIMSDSTPLDEDMITDLLLACTGSQTNPASETMAKELLGQSLVSFDQSTPLPTTELFAIQAGAQNKLPAPSSRVLYTAANDVIPAAKTLLAGTSDESLFFASVAYTYHPDTLAFWFQSSSAFDDFQSWLSVQVATMSTALPPESTRLLGDFGKLTLRGLTESLLLRKDDSDGNEEQSFARLLIHMLMGYTQQQQGSTPRTVGVMPFTLGELFCPRSVILVNVEAHARATPAKVNAEWDIINRSLASPVKIISNKALSKLTSLPRAAARAAMAGAAQQPGMPGSRSAQVVFRKQAPTKFDILKDVMRVLRRMGKVNKSQNVLRTSRVSFARANRRNPDDFNKPGRVVSTQYMPDLHLFLDCSGSITEENYQESVMMMIRLAKRLNVNLYFNSFSHFMSQEVMLRTENKSVKQIWKEFRRIPKVHGGTNYQQIWDYINSSNRHKRRLSLVITDFDWTPPSTRVDHPKNLYYAPCSAMNWHYMVRYAQRFSDQMEHIDPAIRQKLLGMVV